MDFMKLHPLRLTLLVAVAALTVSETPVQAQELMKRAWGMNGGFGIEAAKAWALAPKTKGDCSKSNVVVAVIDTGLDVTHPAIKDSLWVNPKKPEFKADAKKDDKGFINDVHGWDFVRKSGQLIDVHGHGTHIAGIIAGNGKGTEGFKGVCPGVKIMPLRYYDEKGSGEDNLNNTVAAIDYAIDNGATIINYSGGGAMFSRPEFLALKRAQDKGILVVAAAGNEHNNADVDAYYPASYSLSNIVSVTAIDPAGSILPSSNWGIAKVLLAAPGHTILSLAPNGGYGIMTGTSQATAFATGVAALVMSENPGFSMMKVRSVLKESAVHWKKLEGKTETAGYLSAVAALEVASGVKVRKAPVLASTSKIVKRNPRLQKKLAGKLASSPN